MTVFLFKKIVVRKIYKKKENKNFLFFSFFILLRTAFRPVRLAAVTVLELEESAPCTYIAFNNPVPGPLARPGLFAMSNIKSMDPGWVGKLVGGVKGRLTGTWKAGSKPGTRVFTKKTTEETPVST